MKSTELQLQLILLNLYGIKDTPAWNWSFHLSQVNCISLLSSLWRKDSIRFVRAEAKFYLVSYWLLGSEQFLRSWAPVFLIFLRISSLLYMHFQFLGAFFFLKGTFQECSHDLHSVFQELCKERKKPKT